MVNMTIVQIVYGHEVPAEHIESTQSVKRYAQRVGAAYCLLHAEVFVPDGEDPYLYYRTQSEHDRCFILATVRNVLYCDWDITIPDDWDFPKDSAYCYRKPPECMLYNGNDLRLFHEIGMRMPDEIVAGRLDLMTALLQQQFATQKPIRKFPDGVRHSCYHLHRKEIEHVGK